MKIAFFAGNLIPFHARTLDERPLGGTETGVIRLSEALSELGHDVSVFTPDEDPPISTPRYLPQRLVESFSPVDAYITVRDWIPAFYKIQAKQRLYWTGDAYDQFSNYGMGDRRVIKQLHTLLTVSDWQANTLCQASGFPREKAFTIRNGIELSYFDRTETRKRKRLIYSSTPHRGLVHIPGFYLELKKRHPDLELHIFSSYKVYDQRSIPFEELETQLRGLPDCHVHGSVRQDQLAREFLKSSILFYPCHFEETSCITAMEAQAAGCVVLSSELAALPETVGEAGILISGQAGTPDYNRKFLEAADRLLTNDDLFQQLSNKGREQSKNYSWKSVAKRLEDFLMSSLKG